METTRAISAPAELLVDLRAYLRNGEDTTTVTYGTLIINRKSHEAFRFFTKMDDFE